MNIDIDAEVKFIGIDLTYKYDADMNPRSKNQCYFEIC